MTDWQALIDLMKSGSVPALSRLITLVENRTQGWRDIMAEISFSTGNAVTVGITGYPGSGKSSLTGRLAKELAERGKRVGIIAVDPSSHLSGGAFLGDRVRMNEISSLKNVYIRSMGSRGVAGGIHQPARDVARILDAFGKDYILVETVGTGQDEINIARSTQVVVLVCAPGQGDSIQYLKAGILEIADIYAANKSDLPEAEKMLNHLKSMVIHGQESGRNNIPIVKTSALRGEGVSALADEIDKKVSDPEKRDARLRQLATEEVKALFMEGLSRLAERHWSENAQLSAAMDDLMDKRIDPYLLSDKLIAESLTYMLKMHASS